LLIPQGSAAQKPDKDGLSRLTPAEEATLLNKPRDMTRSSLSSNHIKMTPKNDSGPILQRTGIAYRLREDSRSRQGCGEALSRDPQIRSLLNNLDILLSAKGLSQLSIHYQKAFGGSP